MKDLLRVIRADNPGPFTLDGTRVHIVGRRAPVVVDPGPAESGHLAALLQALEGARSVAVLLTHGHADHADAVEPLTRALEDGGVPVTVRGSGHPSAKALADGEAVESEGGPLVALEAPGHTADHLVFHWPRTRALFAGDLLTGEGDTTWVAGYPGCVADYLASLDRLRSLDLEVVHPAHGPALRDPGAALDRFEAHRRHRIAQVREARAARSDAPPEALLPVVYGDTVPPGLEAAALESLEAVLEYVDHHPVDPDARSGVSSRAGNELEGREEE